MAEAAHLAIGDLTRLSGTKVNTTRYYDEDCCPKLNAPPPVGASIATPTQKDWGSFAKAGTSGFRLILCANCSLLRTTLTSPAKRLSDEGLQAVEADVGLYRAYREARARLPLRGRTPRDGIAHPLISDADRSWRW